MPCKSGSFPAEGGCACGKFRYRLEREPMMIHCCHCTRCQVHSGASYSTSLMIESSYVTRLPPKNEPKAELVEPLRAKSSYGQTVLRCPNCYVAMYSHFDSGAGDKVAFIRNGTLDDTNITKPDIYIFTSTKQPWVVLDPSIPKYEEFYSYEDFWPKEALERRAAVYGDTDVAEQEDTKE